MVDPAAANIASDKWLASSSLPNMGCRHPGLGCPSMQSLRTPSSALHQTRGGSAAQHTYRADDREELDFFLRRVPDAIVQEFLPGPEITCDVVCDLEGKVMAIVQRQRIAVRGGEAIKSVTVRIRHWMRLPQDRPVLPAQRPDHRSMYDERTTALFHRDQRPRRGRPAAGNRGRRERPGDAAFLGRRDSPTSADSDYQVGMYMTRCDESVFMTEETVTELSAIIFDLDDTLFPERSFVLGGFEAAAKHAASLAPIDAQLSWHSYISFSRMAFAATRSK